MKQFLFAAFVLLLCACHSSTTSKIKSAIEDFESEGKNIERLNIDSIRYSKGDLHEFYLDKAAEERGFISAQRNLLKTAREINDNPLIVEISYQIEYLNNKAKFLTSPKNSFPSEPKIYSVDYHVDKQTDTYNVNENRKIYFYENSLAPVYINTDSVYQHSNTFILNLHDSTTDVHFLNMNDSLLIAKKALSDELELKVAGGTNTQTILNYQLRIAKLQFQYSNNKLKKLYLYIE